MKSRQGLSDAEQQIKQYGAAPYYSWLPWWSTETNAEYVKRKGLVTLKKITYLHQAIKKYDTQPSWEYWLFRILMPWEHSAIQKDRALLCYQCALLFTTADEDADKNTLKEYLKYHAPKLSYLSRIRESIMQFVFPTRVLKIKESNSMKSNPQRSPFIKIQSSKTDKKGFFFHQDSKTPSVIVLDEQNTLKSWNEEAKQKLQESIRAFGKICDIWVNNIATSNNPDESGKITSEELSKIIEEAKKDITKHAEEYLHYYSQRKWDIQTIDSNLIEENLQTVWHQETGERFSAMRKRTFDAIDVIREKHKLEESIDIFLEICAEWKRKIAAINNPDESKEITSQALSEMIEKAKQDITEKCDVYLAYYSQIRWNIKKAGEKLTKTQLKTKWNEETSGRFLEIKRSAFKEMIAMGKTWLKNHKSQSETEAAYTDGSDDGLWHSSSDSEEHKDIEEKSTSLPDDTRSKPLSQTKLEESSERHMTSIVLYSNPHGKSMGSKTQSHKVEPPLRESDTPDSENKTPAKRLTGAALSSLGEKDIKSLQGKVEGWKKAIQNYWCDVFFMKDPQGDCLSSTKEDLYLYNVNNEVFYYINGKKISLQDESNKSALERIINSVNFNQTKDNLATCSQPAIYEPILRATSSRGHTYYFQDGKDRLQSEVRKEYRVLCDKYHPDKYSTNHDKTTATVIFQEIQNIFKAFFEWKPTEKAAASYNSYGRNYYNGTVWFSDLFEELAQQKIRLEKIIAESERIHAEMEKLNAKSERISAEMEKLNAKSEKISADSDARQEELNEIRAMVNKAFELMNKNQPTSKSSPPQMNTDSYYATTHPIFKSNNSNVISYETTNIDPPTSTHKS